MQLLVSAGRCPPAVYPRPWWRSNAQAARRGCWQTLL